MQAELGAELFRELAEARAASRPARVGMMEGEPLVTGVRFAHGAGVAMAVPRDPGIGVIPVVPMDAAGEQPVGVCRGC